MVGHLSSCNFINFKRHIYTPYGMCVCQIEEIHPQICSGIETRTDKQTAEHQDDRTYVGLPPPQLRQAGDKKLGVRKNVLMRDVIGKVILNTHLFLSKSEQN